LEVAIYVREKERSLRMGNEEFEELGDVDSSKVRVSG
jgi:hypothetical protein